jgi:hypothetical protein
MKELTKEQIEAANKWWSRRLDSPYDNGKWWNDLASFLQLPWEMPDNKEGNSIAQALSESVGEWRFVAAIEVIKEFVGRRNKALLPNPVDKRREKISAILRNVKGHDSYNQIVDEIIAALDKEKP